MHDADETFEAKQESSFSLPHLGDTIMKYRIEIKDSKETIVLIEDTETRSLMGTLSTIKEEINQELDMCFTQWETVDIKITRI